MGPFQDFYMLLFGSFLTWQGFLTRYLSPPCWTMRSWRMSSFTQKAFHRLMNWLTTTCSMINLPHTTHRPINFGRPLISFPLVPSQFYFASLSCPCSFYLFPWIQFNHLLTSKKKKKV